LIAIDPACDKAKANNQTGKPSEARKIVYDRVN